MQNSPNSDKLVIDERKKLTISGVSSVDGFSDQFLKLNINGSKGYITGENIKITSYNNLSGMLTADGTFNSVKYDYKKESLAKKLFK